MESLKKHLPHYISLFAIFGAGLIGFYLFSYDRGFQMAVAISLGLSYVSWGVIHHTIHKDICLQIILEYVAIAILGVIAVFSLIFRA